MGQRYHNSKLVHWELPLCLLGLDDGSLHAYLSILDTYVVLLLLQGVFYETGD